MNTTSQPNRDLCYNFTGRRVVVTGSSRGIGAAIAHAFAEAGAHVIGIQRLDAETPVSGRLQVITADLANAGDVARVIEQVRAGGAVDVLVNNAGTQAWHDSVDFPLDEFDRIVALNLRVVFQLCQAFGADMVTRGAGKIINLASMTSFIGGYRAPAYAASKGAVAQLTKALCNEWAGRGVNVNAIAPGYIDTELNSPLKADTARVAEIARRIPAGRWGDADAVADVALFLASEGARYMHGSVVPVDGGWLAR